MSGLKIPDIWQQEAVGHLQSGKDVVVHAPTGAGKTYIFELLVKAGLKRQAIYTVPTRALANDKLAEWRAKGWSVGIATGDVSEKTEAPVVVATLETQKSKFLRGEGPGLLVIDEYQMLADPSRGMNYELAIALAPPGTQLLLLSGSVANPERLVRWLQNIGREAVLVDHRQRPVPQEELRMEALPDRIPSGIRGFWPRLIARALASDLGPILVFAPQRVAAEALAMKLSSALPTADWLELTAEQRSLAGDPLTRMLRNRIAYHHSGLGYPQRAGLVEPLAKAGQLRVVVATTGLAAGINFCMRSVVVTEREYRHSGRSQLVRPDELLQMFGRAGRRGLDDKGYVLVAPDKPRLAEARPLRLTRQAGPDWPSFLAVMHQAVIEGESPVKAADELSERLFSDQLLRAGLRRLKPSKKTAKLVQPKLNGSHDKPVQKIKEMLNSRGQWERQRPRVKVRLGDSLLYREGGWAPSLKVPESLEGVPHGNLCRLNGDEEKRYGRIVPLATFPKEEGHDRVTLVKSLYRSLRELYQQESPGRKGPQRAWHLDKLESVILPMLPKLTHGGRLNELVEANGTISARLDYTEATVLARVDAYGRALLNPPIREVEPPDFPSFAEMAAAEDESSRSTPAEVWYQLGLINEHKRPTRRGIIFSFFNHGEGLAISAALEDESYPLEDLIYDLANLRAGHRFESFVNTSNRLGDVCRLTYGGLSYPGYLEHGVPPSYGCGASEVLAAVLDNSKRKTEFVGNDLHAGDIERAILEWRSVLNHVCFAPDAEWDRWMDLKDLAGVFIASNFHVSDLPELPELTAAQTGRYEGRGW